MTDNNTIRFSIKKKALLKRPEPPSGKAKALLVVHLWIQNDSLNPVPWLITGEQGGRPRGSPGVGELCMLLVPPQANHLVEAFTFQLSETSVMSPVTLKCLSRSG